MPGEYLLNVYDRDESSREIIPFLFLLSSQEQPYYVFIQMIARAMNNVLYWNGMEPCGLDLHCIPDTSELTRV